jgi:hypothetical protein
MKRQNHTVGQLMHLIRTYGLDDDPDIAPIAVAAEYGCLSEGLAQGYLIQLQERVEELEDFPDYLHRLPEPEQLYAEGRPDIEIGGVIDDPTLRVGLRTDICQDILICGNKGAGKTTAFLASIDGYERHNRENPDHPVSLIIFDRKGGDYAHLPERYGDRWLHLSIHDPRTHIGLNNPPGVPPNVWINQVATIFAARAGLVAAWTCLANMLRFLLGALNPKPQEQLVWPDLKLVLDVARSVPLTTFASKPDYEKSLIGALEAATQATHVTSCSQGLDLERDIISHGRSLVLDISNFDPAWLRRFIVDLLLAQPLYSRIHRQIKGDRPEALFVLDEADPDVTPDADRDYPDQMAVLSQGLRWGREKRLQYAIGLSRLNRGSDYVKAEPARHFIFNQSDARSMRDAQETLALPPAAAAMLPAMRPGECIFRQSQSCWTHPMKVKIDHHAVRREPQTRPFDTHPWAPAKPLAELPQVQQALATLTARNKAEPLKHSKQTRKSPRTITKQAHRLLHAAAPHPFQPVARLWEVDGATPSPEKQNHVREELERAGLAKFALIRISRRNVLLIRLEPEGWRYLGRDVPKHQGRGGIDHQHFAQWLKMVGEKRGLVAKTELILPGTSHPADCAWRQPDGQWTVFEVAATSFDNLESHIIAAFEDSSAVSRLTIVVSQKRIVTQVNDQLQQTLTVRPYLDRVAVETIEPYLIEATES